MGKGDTLEKDILGGEGGRTHIVKSFEGENKKGRLDISC